MEDYTKFTYVGKSYKHSDAKLKVTGEAKYTGDLEIAGNGFCKNPKTAFTWGKTYIG